eukprot:709610-Pelagomonas_calceolata.AAC.2
MKRGKTRAKSDLIELWDCIKDHKWGSLEVRPASLERAAPHSLSSSFCPSIGLQWLHSII